MSEAHDENLPPLPDAKAIRARAAQWILQQRAAEQWRAEDQAALDAWLAQSPAHLVAYWRLDDTWERTNRLAALKRPTSDMSERAEARSILPSLLKIAAAFAVVATMGGAAAYLSLQPREKTYATPIGGHEVVKFADGTRIELNTDTILRTRMTTEQRDCLARPGRGLFSGQARCGASVRRDGRRAAHNRSRHAIPRAPQ